MAEIWPFKGYRYAIKNPEDLGSLISPPYDMLDEATIDRLYRKSDLNAVRIDQNRPESADNANIDRYSHAAALFAEWSAELSDRRRNPPSMFMSSSSKRNRRGAGSESSERE